MSMSAIRPRSWTRSEYEHMVEAGIFGPEDRIELLDGEILEVSPQGSRHAVGNRLAEEGLRKVSPSGFDVRGQLPIALDDISEPEPDIAVVRGGPRDYLDQHPAEPVLLVEVSESSLPHDRLRKLRAYARNSVPEYWIVNLREERVEVHRDPVDEAYTSMQILSDGDHIQPLYAGQPIPVADLLP